MPISDIERAFRQVQARKHTGKLVLTADDNDVVKMASPRFKPPMLEVEELATYFIASAGGDIDLSIARFMISRGAKHVVILCPEVRASVKQVELETQAIATGIHIVPCDFAEQNQLKLVISSLRRDLPPIEGVIQVGEVSDVSDSHVPDEMLLTCCSG